MNRAPQQQKREGARATSSRPASDANRDLLIAEMLANLVDGFERAALFGDLTAAEVKEWLRSRAVFYTAARDLGLVD